MVWSGEVEARTGFLFDGGVGVELCAVVCGDGSDCGSFALDESDDRSIELGGGARTQLSDDDVLGLSLDQGDDAVPVVGTHNGV